MTMFKVFWFLVCFLFVVCGFCISGFWLLFAGLISTFLCLIGSAFRLILGFEIVGFWSLGLRLFGFLLRSSSFVVQI